jgi:hypothetical protein
MRLKLDNQKVHGTYASDRLKDKDGNEYVWRRISTLKPLEAARRLGFNVKEFTVEEKRKVKQGDFHPFINKGFIALGEKDVLTPQSQNQDRDSLPYGTRAIYLHDGQFAVVEKTLLDGHKYVDAGQQGGLR